MTEELRSETQDAFRVSDEAENNAYSQFQEESSRRCEVCGSEKVEEGYAMSLCNECRDKLSKRPIPIQVKLAALILVFIIIFSFVKSPGNILGGIEYERGLRADASGKYMTAMRHFENAKEYYPDSDKVMVQLISSYYENEKIDEAYAVFDELVGPAPEDKKMDRDLVDKVNSITSKMGLYWNPSKELYEKLKEMKNPTPEEIVNTIRPFVEKNQNEVYGAYVMANSLFDLKKFDEANETMTRLLKVHPDFYSGQLLQAATLREMGKYDDAVELAEKVLKHNTEDIGAMISLSKIELKRKNNAKGLEYAKQAYDLDNSEPYVIANLSMAYHFNNMLKERDENFSKYKAMDNKDKYTTDMLTAIFNGTLQWQN